LTLPAPLATVCTDKGREAKQMNDLVRSALVTGASTGIGRACVEKFVAEGWQVFASVRKA